MLEFQIYGPFSRGKNNFLNLRIPGNFINFSDILTSSISARAQFQDISAHTWRTNWLRKACPMAWRWACHCKVWTSRKEWKRSTAKRPISVHDTRRIYNLTYQSALSFVFSLQQIDPLHHRRRQDEYPKMRQSSSMHRSRE